MNIISQRLTAALAAFVSAVFSFASVGQSLDGLQSIKLITQQVGWAANANDLYWTTDGGIRWENRTPATATREAIADVFF